MPLLDVHVCCLFDLSYCLLTLSSSPVPPRPAFRCPPAGRLWCTDAHLNMLWQTLVKAFPDLLAFSSLHLSCAPRPRLSSLPPPPSGLPLPMHSSCNCSADCDSPSLPCGWRLSVAPSWTALSLGHRAINPHPPPFIFPFTHLHAPVMFAILFIGYAVWGHLLYGRDLAEFSSIGGACLQLLQVGGLPSLRPFPCSCAA